MTVGFPAIDFNKISTERQGLRAGWDVQFDKNLLKFADRLADAIARQALVDFQKVCSDPYGRKELMSLDVSLNIMDNRIAQKVLDLVSGTNAVPTPFLDWLQKFAKVNDSFEFRNQIDREYFGHKISCMGRLVEIRMKQTFTAFTKDPHKNLQFTINWCEKGDTLSKTGLCGDNVLRVDLSLKNSKQSVALIQQPKFTFPVKQSAVIVLLTAILGIFAKALCDSLPPPDL